MSRLHFGVLVAALVLAATVLSACGSSNSNSADNSDITAAITKAATSGDPAACTSVQTPDFNAQTNGGNGSDPTKSCEQNAAQTAAKTVDVTNIKVNGGNATADVAITGATLDGQTIGIALVKDGSQWKLDKVNSFIKFDRNKLIAAFGAQVTSGAPAWSVACAKQQSPDGNRRAAAGRFLDADRRQRDVLGLLTPG